MAHSYTLQSQMLSREHWLKLFASHYLPDLKTEGVSEWFGQRPMMADSKPVISASPRHRNVFYAFGHGHYGLTQGPTSGRIIADMVVGKELTVDMKPFQFERFK